MTAPELVALSLVLLAGLGVLVTARRYGWRPSVAEPQPSDMTRPWLPSLLLLVTSSGLMLGAVEGALALAGAAAMTLAAAAAGISLEVQHRRSGRSAVEQAGKEVGGPERQR